MSMSIHNGQGKKGCGVRDKYTKSWKDRGELTVFQLYTTYSKPGLVSIFSYDDQRSFHNWGFEVGTGPKRGRIREVMDHQINTPVLEIAGHHNGSVYMVCPPDSESTINVDMPYVTMLMRDILGYSSVEFRVLDSLGFSRKICAKNFRSKSVIGEVNCEIPMRLSPTWNYKCTLGMQYVYERATCIQSNDKCSQKACVNLDETLRSAFGTKLVSVQRIKINANLRIRRIYFHEEVFPFKNLPQEFRIKLLLSPQEKQEIQIYEEFMSNEPTTLPEKNIPWCMPRLKITKRLDANKSGRMSQYNLHHGTIRKHQFEIMEVPLKEEDSDKYTDVHGVTKIQPTSNTGLLREMLHKSIPPNKILLPTLSLIYPESKINTERGSEGNVHDDSVRNKGNKKGKLRTSSSSDLKCDDHEAEETTERLRKMKKCIEQSVLPTITTVSKIEGEALGENGNSRSNSPIPQQQALTDWERFHGHEHDHPEESNMDNAASHEHHESQHANFETAGKERLGLHGPTESRNSHQDSRLSQSHQENRFSQSNQESRNSQYSQQGSRYSQYSNQDSRSSQYSQQESRGSQYSHRESGHDDHHGHHHHHHHHHHHTPHHKCGKYGVSELAQYLKYREVYGDYDMFTATLGNKRFLEPPQEELDEDPVEYDEYGESDEGSNSDEEETDEEDRERKYGHGPENPFLRVSTNVSRRSSSSIVAGQPVSRQEGSYPGYLAKSSEVDGEGTGEAEHVVTTTDSWPANSAYNKISTNMNQKSVSDVNKPSNLQNTGNKSDINNKKEYKSPAAVNNTVQLHGRQRSKSIQDKHQHAILELYRRAGPMKIMNVMKQEFVNLTRNSKAKLENDENANN